MYPDTLPGSVADSGMPSGESPRDADPAASDTVLRAVSTLRTGHAAQPYPSAAVRRERLKRLRRLVTGNADALATTIARDFAGGRSPDETRLAEILGTVKAIDHARARLGGWMRRRGRAVPLHLQPARAWLQPVPKGVVGILAPWNYPVLLSLSPLVAALAAGNRVLVKPSERTPRTADLLASLLGATFGADEVAVVTGGPETGRAVSRAGLDHLLFTGSTAIGRAVAQAAAATLTPVTLELGGKSPAIVAPDADAEAAGATVARGKAFNAGQTCIAPDYVLVPEGALGSFAQGFRHQIAAQYPDLMANPDYTGLIDARHRDRLTAMVADAAAKGVDVLSINPGDRQAPAEAVTIPPILLLDPPDDLVAHREEIFGPVLPILPYASLDGALARARRGAAPLALYLFTQDRAVARKVVETVPAGAVVVNDTLVHAAVETLPFGGIGASGQGAYHGRAGFDTFSHLKPVFRRGPVNPTGLLAPPYTGIKRLLLGLLTR